MEIPKQLRHENFRFVKLGKWDEIEYDKNNKPKYKGKAPFEKEWQKRGYKYNSPELIKHISLGNNFGVIGGYGNLIILDIDDQKLGKEFEKTLNTFTNETGGGGRHFYFICDYKTNHVLINELGELRARNYQVVSAPCKHPSGNYYKTIKDVPILKITSEKLKEIINPYLREEQPLTQTDALKGQDTSRSGLEFRKCIALLREGKTREEVYKTMGAYSKWASATDDYRSLTFEKAENFVLSEKEGEIKVSKTIKPSKQIFLKTKKIFSKYLDTSELNYNLITAWTLGTPFHEQMETYPLLIIGGRKQTAKTRTIKLISTLSEGSDGSISTSITETYLFRHQKGAVFFDEMESISSREKTALRETINSVYKKGNKIVRYTEKRVDGTKQYVEENFYPFYPLGLANIYGFGDVLTDRSLQLILQRSDREQTKLIEDFATNPEILALKEQLSQLDAKIPAGIFSEWNDYIKTGEANAELKDIFEAIAKTNLTGRPLEIFFPLFVVAKLFGVLPILIKCSEEYMAQLEGEFVDSVDDLLQNFMDKTSYSGFVNLSQLLSDFKGSLEEPEDWMNSKWFGRALKRLGLIGKKRLVNGRVQVMLNINTTNTTDTTNSTNTTNSTKEKEKVELGEFVELKELVDTDKNTFSEALE